MITKESLKQYVMDNPMLVTMRESQSYPGLYVLKYRKKVFYDGLWNEYLEQCRGTVVDNNFNLVSYPFQKIYNYGIEVNAPKLSDDTIVTAYRKVNGFLWQLPGAHRYLTCWFPLLVPLTVILSLWLKK